MLNIFIQNATPPRGHGVTSMFRHLGALGLFFLAILDSSPLPTFGGPDILTAILAATHRNPWYEYAAVATAGSVIGAYLTFKIARRAGSAYLHSKFGYRKLDVILSFFHKWGTGAIAVSTAVPFPWPTSVLFAAAGASNYGVGRRGRMVDGPEIENSGPQCCSVSGNLRLVCEVGEVESKLLRIMSLMCDQLRRILAPHPPARALAASAFSGNCSQAGLHLAG